MILRCEECKEVEAEVLYTEDSIPIAYLCIPCYELFTGTKFVVPSV